MRYLVTGAQGFVGRYLTAAIFHQEPASEVLGIGRSPCLPGQFSHYIGVKEKRRAKLPLDVDCEVTAHYRYKTSSVLDQEKITSLINDFRPACIFHLASGLRDDNSHDLITTNVQGTTALMNAIAASRAPMPTVVVGSTGGVYGRVKSNDLPLTESRACDPADFYSITKLAAEQISRMFGRFHDIPVITARIFNIVGAGQDERHVCGRFAAKLQSVVASGKNTFTVGNLENTRDFIDVRDVANALILLARSGKPDYIYNVGTGVETSIREVLELSMAISSYCGTWTPREDTSRAIDVPRHAADITRLKQLGFEQSVTLADSLADVAAYYREFQEI